MRRQARPFAWLAFAACLWVSSPFSAGPKLRFEENCGQFDESVRFLARASGYTLYLTDDGAVFDLRGAEPVRMSFVDANPGALVRGENRLPGRTNYLIGNRSGRWHTNVPSHSRVVYEALYPGIDAVFRESGGEIEMDFVVEPGSDAGRIGLELEGARSMELSDDGSLILASAAGELRLHAPVLYQPEHDGPARIEGRFVARTGGRIRFAIGEYDRSRKLVIDPVLSFSTYLGGQDDGEEVQDLAVDLQGNTYVSGFTYSDDFPLANPMDSTIDSTIDAFVTKIDADGSTLVYSTYYGGDRDDNFTGSGIAVNSAGEAFLTGATGGGTFPTTGGAFEEDPQGLTDCYVAKLAADGSSFLYSTLLGGSTHDRCRDIAVDVSGNAFVVGEANSSNFPTTTGAFQESMAAPSEVFVTKVNASGSDLAYSTFIGGSSADAGHGIALIGGDAVITGQTASTVNYPLAGAFQGLHGGGIDAFVTRLNAAGSALVYSSFLGGSGFDYGLGIASDGSDGSVFVTGYTKSTSDFPTTVGAFQTTFGGGAEDVFVVKVDATGGLVYSTLIGGSGNDKATGIAVSGGFPRITGSTTSLDFPVELAIQPEQAYPVVPQDAFVTTVSDDGSALAFSTYFGGQGSEGLRDEAGIAVGPGGAIHVAGRTSAEDFPTTLGSFQDSDPDALTANTVDGFVAKIHECDTTGLHFTSRDDFQWSPTGLGQCNVRFDAVRGDLFGVRSTGGDFGGAICIENDHFDTVAMDNGTPISGQGYWYLSRVDGSTWASANQTGDRDSTLGACP